jgi:quercetin dioxygenase-like cupin family protein
MGEDSMSEQAAKPQLSSALIRPTALPRVVWHQRQSIVFRTLHCTRVTSYSEIEWPRLLACAHYFRLADNPGVSTSSVGSYARANNSSGTIRAFQLQKGVCRMRPKSVRIAFAALTAMLVGFVGILVSQTRSAQSSSPTTFDTGAKPLLLEKNEGELRTWRPEPGEAAASAGFIKVSPKNNGSQHLVLMTGDLAPGDAIPTHKHLGQDEILVIEKGTVHVYLGDQERDLHAGGLVFIPAYTWVGVKNNGTETESGVAIFSAPGFEDHIRCETVLAIEKPTPISRAEEKECDHLGHVVYRDRGETEPSPLTTTEATAKPLLLEKNEGERRVMRGYPGHPGSGRTFILKVDPKNGGSQHLVLMTADGRPGQGINAHRHPDSDEVLYFLGGTGRVHLGDAGKILHAGGTVFIPSNTWISVDNIGGDVMSTIAVFSTPGFEEFVRAVSVREGEKNVPMSKEENDAVERKYEHAVMFREP